MDGSWVFPLTVLGFVAFGALFGFFLELTAYGNEYAAYRVHRFTNRVRAASERARQRWWGKRP